MLMLVTKRLNVFADLRFLRRGTFHCMLHARASERQQDTNTAWSMSDGSIL